MDKSGNLWSYYYSASIIAMRVYGLSPQTEIAGDRCVATKPQGRTIVFLLWLENMLTESGARKEDTCYLLIAFTNITRVLHITRPVNRQANPELSMVPGVLSHQNGCFSILWASRQPPTPPWRKGTIIHFPHLSGVALQRGYLFLH